MDVEPSYAKSGDRHIAYEVLGEGPIDLLALNNGSSVWIDRDDEPHWSRFDRRLASVSRLIRFDPSGVGLSDPLDNRSGPTVDLWAQDAVAVLDAVGSTRAAVFGVSEGALVAMLLSATQPQRVSALVLMHAWARMVRDADYPCGVPQHVIDRFVDAVTDPSYEGDSIDDLALSAPSVAGDPEFRAWWRRAGQRVGGPAAARGSNLLATGSDLRTVLPLIDAPVLLLHRLDNAFVRVGHARYLAEHITGARLVELTGRDHLPFVGDTDVVLDEIEEFLTGTRSTANVDRVLATILFTDIVGSTEQAVQLGDRKWRELLDNHDRIALRQLQRFGGRQVKTTGDGILATLDGPARAVQCGRAICEGAHQLGIEVRVGVHTGEVERRGDDVAGIGVHIAARVQGLAEPGRVWVSRTVTDLVTGSGIEFTDCGEHTLKGVPGTWQLFAVEG